SVTNAFLQGQFLEIGIQKNGSFGSNGGSVPTGYHPHGGGRPCSGGTSSVASVYDWGHDGWSTGTPAYMGDYTLPGSPWEEWAIEANSTVGYASSTACSGTTFTGGGSLTGGNTSFTSTGGSARSTWDGTFLSGSLNIHKEHRVDTFANAVIITVTLTNTTSSAISGVYYMRTCDPDNNQSWSGSFSTRNIIPYQTLLTPDPFNRVMVQAISTGSASVTGTPATSLSITTKDCRAKAVVYTSWPLSTASSLPLRNIWSGSSVSGLGTSYYTTSTNVTSDIAIGLVYNIGTINAGDSATICYAYCYDGTIGVDSAFPEPQMVVQGVAYDSVDTVTSCMLPAGSTTLPVDISNAEDKVWTRSVWTWAPATGLASTTGAHNYIDFSAITTTTTYTITGTDSAMGTCGMKTFLLTVIPVTVATPITRDTTYCLGITPPDLSYNVTGTYLSYFTSATGGTGTSVPPVPSTASLGTTTYYVSQVVAGCASTRVPINITIVPPPTIFLTNNGPLCPGDRLNITLIDTTGSASLRFTWTGPGGFTASTQNVNIASAAYSDSGVYRVTADNNGCASYASTTVVVHSTPPSPVYSNPVYCQYLPTNQLTASGSNVLWYTASTGGIGSPVAPTPSSAVAGTFTWYVTQTINGCESARYPVVVTINPKPAPPTVYNNPGSYCFGAAFNAFTFAPGTGTPLWYTSMTGGTGNPTAPVVNTRIPGTVTNYVSQTVLGCESDRSPIDVTVYDSVVAHFTATKHLGCSEDTVVVSNTSYGAINYLWEFGDGTTSASVSTSHIYAHQGVYVIKLYAHSLYCVDSLAVTVDLNHPNVAAFSLTPAVVCQNQLVTFSNTTVASFPHYSWTFGDGFGSTQTAPVHIYKHPGTYSVRLVSTDTVHCTDTAYGSVTVDSLSQISIDLSDTVLCRGAYITITGHSTSIGATDFKWDFGNGDSLHNVNPVVYAYPTSGLYTVTATAAYRVCPTVSTARTLYVSPAPAIDLGPDTSICDGSIAVTLTDRINSGTAGASWIWNTGETTSSIGVTAAGTYFATVSVGGCAATDSVLINDDCYLSFPTCFTPNFDGINDFFNPRDFMLKGVKTFKLRIYNRWGQLIFETSNTYGKGWDGKFNDQPQPSGVYVYLIDAEFNDGKKETHQGNLTLLR
ncbi:MAG: PKD domain-containing protein, partial [Chitinophagia bacterium]|nr:PKD domain-containing protein [Chitinophagia bacterium]